MKLLHHKNSGAINKLKFRRFVMKKHKFLMAFIALAMGAVGLAGCGENPTPAPDPEPGWKKADKAMTTFGEKLALGNYRMISDDLIDVSAVGVDEVVFHQLGQNIKEWAVMSVDGEAFQASLPKNEDMKNLTFIDRETALKASEIYLPNAFFNPELTHKTIWELLYNPDATQNPYHFVARNNTAYPQTIVGNMVSFGNEQAASISDIALDFDSIDVNIATFSFKYKTMGNPPVIVDAKLTITFGTYESDSRVDAWISNPDRTYPAAVGSLESWKNTKFWIDLQSSLNVHEDNIDEVVPFISEASYAVVDNAATFLYSDKEVDKIRDYHGTEEQVNNYKETLIRNEYTPVKLDDGSIHYRRILRTYRDVTGNGVFADIQVKYDNGFYMEVTMFYDEASYDSLESFNAAITAKDFVALPADTGNVFSNWDGLEYTFHAYESHTCLQDYTLYIIMYADYTNLSAAKAYIKSYTDVLEETYHYSYAPNDNEWILQTKEHEWKFRVSFTSDDKLKIDINVQDFVLGSVIANAIKGYFPAFDDEATYVKTGRDIRDYAKFQYGYDCDLAYETIFSFEGDSAKANKFGKDYKDALEADGFTSTGEKDGYKVYTKDNKTVRVAIGGPGSDFVGLDFYVYSA